MVSRLQRTSTPPASSIAFSARRWKPGGATCRRACTSNLTGESSNLFDPKSDFTLENFSRGKGTRLSPIPAAGETRNLHRLWTGLSGTIRPSRRAERLVALIATDRGYELSFSIAWRLSRPGGSCLAIGVVPFKHTPSSLAHLPMELTSHSSDYGPLDRLEGQEVTVLGGGSSALDVAALLSMRGAAVTIISRHQYVNSNPAGFRSLRAPENLVSFRQWPRRRVVVADLWRRAAIHSSSPGSVASLNFEQHPWSIRGLFHSRSNRSKGDAQTWTRHRAG